MSAEGTISNSFMKRIVRTAIELGANKPKVMALLETDDAALSNPLGRISGMLLIRMLHQLALDLGDPAIALKIGQNLGPRGMSDLGYATRFLPNLAATLSANIELQGARQTMAVTSFDPNAKAPVLTWTHRDSDPDIVAGTTELSLSGFMRIASDAQNEPMDICRIEFAHRPRFDISIYEGIFNCPVTFNAEKSAAWLTARQLFRPSHFANAELQVLAHARLNQPMQWISEGKNASARTFLYLSIELDKSPLTLDRIAIAFGMTERTLRRKLVEEGNPFRELLDKVREDLWVLYNKEGNRSLSEIAVLLGYSELSAFTRSRKRWLEQNR